MKSSPEPKSLHTLPCITNHIKTYIAIIIIRCTILYSPTYLFLQVTIYISQFEISVITYTVVVSIYMKSSKVHTTNKCTNVTTDFLPWTPHESMIQWQLNNKKIIINGNLRNAPLLININKRKFTFTKTQFHLVIFWHVKFLWHFHKGDRMNIKIKRNNINFSLNSD